MQYLSRVLLVLCLALTNMLSMSAQAQNTDGTANASKAAEEAAKATPPPPSESAGFFKNMGGVAKQIALQFSKDVQSSLTAAGMGFASKTIAPALALAGSLALMYLMYEVVQFMGSGGSFLNRLFDVGVPAGIAALLISNYAANIAMFEEVLNLFRSIAGSPASSVMNFYSSILTMISTAISTSFDNFLTTVELTEALTNPGSIIPAALDALATVIFAIFILFIVFSSIAEILGLLLLGHFLYAVGLAFGPLMIAGIVTPWTREYLGKWVGFIVGSAVLSGVLAVVISIAITMFGTLGISIYAEGQPTAASLAIVAVMLMAVNNLINQAPAIASALVPGSIGARTAGGAGFNSASGKAAKGTAKTVTKTAGLARTAIDKMRAGRNPQPGPAPSPPTK